jgi:hypothetical protein
MRTPHTKTQGPTRARQCTGVALALLIGGASACASTDSPLPSPELTAITSSSIESPAPSTTPGKTNEGILPGEIVGAWETAGGDATLTYRFLADGRYRFAALLTQPVPEGVFELTHVESGTATVDGDALILHPSTATATRSHPGDPDGDYTDRPEPLTPKYYRWRFDHGVLLLVDEAGLELTFDRQP